MANDAVKATIIRDPILVDLALQGGGSHWGIYLGRARSSARGAVAWNRWHFRHVGGGDECRGACRWSCQGRCRGRMSLVGIVAHLRSNEASKRIETMNALAIVFFRIDAVVHRGVLGFPPHPMAVPMRCATGSTSLRVPNMAPAQRAPHQDLDLDRASGRMSASIHIRFETSADGANARSASGELRFSWREKPP